jgi:type III pantothenate kinase
MIVLIDIGNSNIVIAQYDTAFGPTYRYTTDKTKSVDEYYVLFKDVMDGATDLVVSSVVPELNIIIKNMAQKYLGITPMFVGPGIKTGVKLIVDNPKEVGADLVAAAAATIEHYGDDAIIVDMGTATTFTLLEDRVIKGAAFMAGLVTQRNCLVGNASQLSQFEFKTPEKVLGTNTIEALNSGMLYGHALMIQAMAAKIRSEYHTDAPLILTGGASRFVQDLFDETVVFDQHLVLKGLLVIYQKNQRGAA